MGHATAFLALSFLNPGERSKGQISFFNHKTISMIFKPNFACFLTYQRYKHVEKNSRSVALGMP